MPPQVGQGIEGEAHGPPQVGQGEEIEPKIPEQELQPNTDRPAGQPDIEGTGDTTESEQVHFSECLGCH